MGKYLYIEGCHQCRHYSNKSGIHSCHMSGCAGDLPNYPKIPNKCRLPDALDNTQQRIQPIAEVEVVRLRKWQSEAVQYLDDALEYLQNQISVWKEYNRHKVYQSTLDDINRLIAEAEEEE